MALCALILHNSFFKSHNYKVQKVKTFKWTIAIEKKEQSLTKSAEISESLEKVLVSTTFAESRKVSVSKNPKLQSWESLGLERFENLQSQKVSVSKKQKI